MPFDFDASKNNCKIGDAIHLNGFINGSGNSVEIQNGTHECKIDLRISGNGNQVLIRSPFAVKGLSIRIGNHVPAHQTSLLIDVGFSIEGGGNFLLYNSGNRLEIGSHCMFSNTVTIRCGDSPHLLFDKETGEYLDISDGVFIGNHVWVGERVYITKRARIGDESVAAACAVVTKSFDEPNVVIAGNPGKVVRRNIQWIRNHAHLPSGSKYKESFDRRKAIFDSAKGGNS